MITSGFVGLGVASGSTLNDFHAFQLLSTCVMWPMFMLSGVFFPIDVSPLPLQIVMLCDPMFYGVELLRWCLLGAGSPFLGPLGWVIYGSIAAIICGGIFVLAVIVLIIVLIVRNRRNKKADQQ